MRANDTRERHSRAPRWRRRQVPASLLAVFLVVLTACVAPPAGDVAHPEAARGRELFVAGDYAGALERFTNAAREAPDDPLAALGIARSHHQLHQYDEALDAYQRTLDLAPDDPLAWEGYLGALTWGGVLLGNGRWIERALELAPTALEQAPGNPEIYAHLRTAAANLNRLDEYAAVLTEAAEASPEDQVLRIEQRKALIEDARRAHAAAVADDASDAAFLGDQVVTLETPVRVALHNLTERGGRDQPPGTLYLMAVGYALLDEHEQAETALEALERTAGGRKMAAALRYERFLSDWIASFGGDTATRLAVLDRWLPRFKPAWNNDGQRNRAVLGMQFDLLVREARDLVAAAPDGAAGQGLSEDEADRIAAAGRRLARIDTWGSASHYVDTVSILAGTPSHYVTAVRIAEDGVEALHAARPGLLYPGTPESERERLRMRYTAVLMQLQGQALHNLGRDDEAEEVLRQAIALHPVAASYAVLGGLLLDQERAAEAFDLFVAALAHGFTEAEALLEQQTRASAFEAADAVGASREVIGAAVAFAAERIAEERDREIVADPLDAPAPDFELGDTAGGSWVLSELGGKVVVLNFWATWCGPCIAEMPFYQQLVDEYADADDVVFLAISTDSDPTIVAPFIEERGHDFTVLYDNGAAIDFRVTGIPAHFVIGKDGLIKYRSSGFPGSERYLKEMRLKIEAQR